MKRHVLLVAHCLLSASAACAQTRSPVEGVWKIEYFELWKWFVGISGHYEVEGSTIVMRPIVGKNPWDMTRHIPYHPEFELDGSDRLNEQRLSATVSIPGGDGDLVASNRWMALKPPIVEYSPDRARREGRI